jgi:hypothetical protein
MIYRITGLDPAAFANIAGAKDADLAARHAVRVIATAKPGYRCRITLEDAEPGETLLLLNHVSHHLATPDRDSYAIFIREVLADPQIAYIDAHTAAHGCFAAKVEPA